MALRINTNVSALNAHKSMIKNDNRLSDSLQRLSTGLRINKAADDASGMSIADSLRSQALGLGQAIRNGNDGINIVQTADGALEESINIINTIKTKSVQAAQDGQTTESRAAIQADINKLMEQLDSIAETTSFNGQKLLSGSYTNKRFQVGAFSGETIGISIGAAQSTKIGHTTSAKLSLADNQPGTVDLTIFSNQQNRSINIQSVEVAFNNSKENGMGAVASSINQLSDSLGITAAAIVSSTTDLNVAAGSTNKDFSINGITIGEVAVQTNDKDGALAKAINTKKKDTGVTASVDTSGKLTLTSDGRAIKVETGGSGTEGVLRNTDMTTVGHVILNQTGSGEIIVNNVGGGDAVSLTSNLETKGASGAFTLEATLKKDSVLAENSVLSAGWKTGQSITGADISNANITTTQDSLLAAGSVLITSSKLAANSDITSSVRVQTTNSTTGESIIAEGSILKAATEIGANTVLGGDAVMASGIATTQTVGESLLKENSIVAQASTIAANTTLGGDFITSGAATSQTVGDSLLTANSIIASGSKIAAGSVVGGDMELHSGVTSSTTTDSLLKAGSIIGSGSTIAANSVMGANTTLNSSGSTSTVGSSLLKAGSILGSGTIIAANSEVGAIITLKSGSTTATVQDSLLKAGSVLGSGSVIGKGTVVGADVTLTSGTYTSTEDGVLTNNSIITSGSILKAGTVLAAGQTLIVSSGGTGWLVSGTLTSDYYTSSGNQTLTAGGITTLKAGSILGIANNEVGIVLGTGSSFGANVTTSGLTITTLTEDMIAKAGSVLTTQAEQSKLATGSYWDADITTGSVNGLTTLVNDMTLNAGSKIVGLGSMMATGSYLGASVQTASGSSTTLTNDMTLFTGSKLFGTSTLENGSYFGADVTTSYKQQTLTDNMILKEGSILEGSSTLKEGSNLGAEFGTSGSTTLTRDMTLQAGSVVASGSTLKTGSYVGAKITTKSDMTLTQDMTLQAGSKLLDDSTLASGSKVAAELTTKNNMTLQKDATITSGSKLVINNDFTIAGGSTVGGSVDLDRNVTLTGDFTMAVGSTLADGSVLTDGSGIGGSLTLANDETVDTETDMMLKQGSVLAAGSTIAAGTFLTEDITAVDGSRYTAGTVLKKDLVTGTATTLTTEMTLQNGSIMKAGTVLAPNDASSSFATAEVGESEVNRLSGLSVLTQEDAQKAIAIAEAALKDLDKNRADLGSVQNQLTSTISNISTTMVNIYSSESSIRDVDFAEEAQNFSKLQILAQSGAYAMSQANASSQIVMSLLQ
jgi:flagellin-like hook-associated protein FlgL